MSKLISDILQDAVCEQIGHEIYNGNLYAYIAAFLKNNKCRHSFLWQESRSPKKSS